jgi:hypothetical protein
MTQLYEWTNPSAMINSGSLGTMVWNTERNWCPISKKIKIMMILLVKLYNII